MENGNGIAASPNLFELSNGKSPSVSSLGSNGTGTPPGPSSVSQSTIKNRMKGYFNKSKEQLKTSWSNTQAPQKLSPNGTAVAPSPTINIRHRNMEPEDKLNACRKDLDASLRYFRETIRTGKFEMLGGSANVVLDVILKLLLSFDDSGQPLLTRLDLADTCKKARQTH